MGRMDRDAFAALLAAGPLLSDGGMGTSLVARGVAPDACFELLNATAPELVASVHRGFVEAGARLVMTNTFGASRYGLGRFGLADRVAELNLLGVELARGSGAIVAGSVGPLRVRLAPFGRVRPEEAFEAFAEQISAQAEAGVDLLAIETQTDLAEVEQAVAAARAVAPELPLVVTMTFTRDDRTITDASPENVAERLAGLGADALGVNCGEGPAQALRVARAMHPFAAAVPLVARPNAGGPLQIGGRFLYPATPEYVAENAASLLDEGVAVIGGCCGTGPEHTRAIAAVLARPRHLPARVEDAEPRTGPGAGEPHAEPPTDLGSKLAQGRFVVAVEMEPPRGFSVSGMIAGAETLAEAGADVIDVADSPMARMRMSPWAACRLIQERVGVETVLHFPTRGRNLLRLQGDLLAVHALGIRNVFVCLGDPVAIGDYPKGTDNVDVTATGLITLITGAFNVGRDRAGASIGEPTSFLVGCAVNPSAPDLVRELRLVRRKVDAGASFALSQPVFDVATLEGFVAAYGERYGPLALPILAGILPLASARHAGFLHNEVPGVVIPEAAIERLRAAGDRASQEGLRLASDLVGGLRATHAAAGIYLMPQFGRFDVAAEVVEAARA
jgi:methionine synthase I (cobalamin-dependent)/5,10-methylenetetrahydrofolate reductase